MDDFNHVLTFLSRPGFVAVDVANDEEALRLGRLVAEATGFAVVVRDAQLAEIDIIPAPRKN